MAIAVVQFLGSTCDRDALVAFQDFLGVKTDLVWHLDLKPDYDGVIIPGGFTFGDALRAGAIAARSPALNIVRSLADEGTPVLGICNGFQILIESGLLPGALLPNITTTFLCQWITLNIESTNSILTKDLPVNKKLHMPIAHGEGRYYCSEAQLKALHENEQIILRYCEEDGSYTSKSNPNGSIDNIAGISNQEGNVMGMMPHPERNCYPELSPTSIAEGLILLEASFFSSLFG